jgi:hypothetical protein
MVTGYLNENAAAADFSSSPVARHTERGQLSRQRSEKPEKVIRCISFSMKSHIAVERERARRSFSFRKARSSILAL